MHSTTQHGTAVKHNDLFPPTLVLTFLSTSGIAKFDSTHTVTYSLRLVKMTEKGRCGSGVGGGSGGVEGDRTVRKVMREGL